MTHVQYVLTYSHFQRSCRVDIRFASNVSKKSHLNNEGFKGRLQVPGKGGAGEGRIRVPRGGSRISGYRGCIENL